MFNLYILHLYLYLQDYRTESLTNNSQCIHYWKNKVNKYILKVCFEFFKPGCNLYILNNCNCAVIHNNTKLKLRTDDWRLPERLDIFPQLQIYQTIKHIPNNSKWTTGCLQLEHTAKVDINIICIPPLFIGKRSITVHGNIMKKNEKENCTDPVRYSTVSGPAH